MALLINPDVQALVLGEHCTLATDCESVVVKPYLSYIRQMWSHQLELGDKQTFVEAIREIRPEVDIIIPGEESREYHQLIVDGLARRYQAPLFDALQKYSERVVRSFHALPVGNGNSINGSVWMADMFHFFGSTAFSHETSSNSIHSPYGQLDPAQRNAARAFGSQHTFFTTDGASCCNKIVLHALLRVGDIALVSRNCHKSIHYGLVLCGARVIYLDSYTVGQSGICGGTPLATIKSQLLALKANGELSRVKMLVLTNCTFDGIVYNVQRVMEECLAIKEDLVFFWDEAWFAFAYFHPIYRQRTAMWSARAIHRRFANDPRVRVRVYSVQSNHKTLTSLRQGAMINIYDQDFADEVEFAFAEAYKAYTTTSPSYLILASMDLGRRQMEIEGGKLVQKQLHLAVSLRRCIREHPLLQRHFQPLTAAQMIPSEYRRDTTEMMRWHEDEFVLDPTRVTLRVVDTGMNAVAFKDDVLLQSYGIQINKTTNDTVLINTTIGTTQDDIEYLIASLLDFARQLESREKTAPCILSLPDIGSFHEAFCDGSAIDVRLAHQLSLENDKCQYLSLEQLLQEADEWISASFICPYPPGSPLLVPGQIITSEVLCFLRDLQSVEIHGYEREVGIRVFTRDALDNLDR